MFDLDSLFLENTLDDNFYYDNDVTLTTTEEGFVWCDCSVDESNVIDGDPFEFITEAMYQNVINSNNINMAILADNFSYLKENGYELVHEEGKFKDQIMKKKDAIVAFFKKVKQKIIQFFETIVEKMQKLQAKFLMLFKKARETAGKNITKVTGVKIPAYIPEEVVEWAKEQYNNLVESYSSKDFPRKDDIIISAVDNLNKELAVLKNYGKHVSNVKKLKKEALKALSKQEKEIQVDLDKQARLSPTDTMTKKEMHSDYAKISNAILSVSKEAVSLIMARVNAAAKVINKAVFYKEPSADDKKKKDEKKQATEESASYLDRLQMI